MSKEATRILKGRQSTHAPETDHKLRLVSLSVPKPGRRRRTGRDRRQGHGIGDLHNAGPQSLTWPIASTDNGAELGTRSFGGRGLWSEMMLFTEFRAQDMSDDTPEE
ncbi:unnamed protein product [Cercospora beticola]|nr:unnamed protein product [Cercospora beticola]